MYNDITIYANDIETQKGAAIAAYQLTQRFNGTLTALYHKLDQVDLLSWRMTPLDSAAGNLVQKMQADLDQQEYDRRKVFSDLSEKYECETIWHTVSQHHDPSPSVLCTDLIVVDQPNADSANYEAQQSTLNQAILETKRPVLMVPCGADKICMPANITLGWNSSAESMRAASDALPFLSLCDHVDIVSFIDGRISEHEQAGIYQIKDYLLRKKINNQLLIQSADKPSQVPERFLSHAAQSKADLIVVGAYGRSRIREIILGGMTDYLIQQSAIPVLFSH